MAATLIPPVSELDVPSDNGCGNGGGAFDPPEYAPQENSGPKPEHFALPLSAYWVALWVGIVWIATLFIALTCVATSLRHSKHWTGMSLPHFLYVDSVILILSNLSIEFARFALGTVRAARRGPRWLFLTVLLGIGFAGGQIVTWNEVASQGLHFVSNATRFCVYLMTGTQMVFALVGIAMMVYTISAIRGVAGIEKRLTAAGMTAIYWHFISAAWFYVLIILFTLAVRGGTTIL